MTCNIWFSMLSPGSSFLPSSLVSTSTSHLNYLIVIIQKQNVNRTTTNFSANVKVCRLLQWHVYQIKIWYADHLKQHLIKDWNNSTRTSLTNSMVVAHLTACMYPFILSTNWSWQRYAGVLQFLWQRYAYFL